MTAFQMFKSAKVRRLESQIECLEDKAEQFESALTDMTEARDAVAAGAKYLRAKCDRQEAVLKMIAAHGSDNPTWAAKIAKAAVESA